MVQLENLEALARDVLRVDADTGARGWAFHRVSRDEIEQPGAGTFDRRVRMDAFAGTHMSLRLTLGPEGRRVASMTLFVLRREHFEHVRFWRSLGPTSGAVVERISLGQLPPCAGASRVVMHGYIEGPSQPGAGQTAVSHSGGTINYIRFLILLAAQCQAQCVPMLIEVTGRAALDQSRRSKLRLTAEELTAEEIATIGLARPASFAAERIARCIGLREVSGTWNERTLGKVYCSVPRVERRVTVHGRVYPGTTELPGGVTALVGRGR